MLGIRLPKVSTSKPGLEPCTEPRIIRGVVDGVRDLTQVVYIAIQDGRGKGRSIGLRPDPNQWETQRDRRSVTCFYRAPPNSSSTGIQGVIDNIVVGNKMGDLLSTLEQSLGAVKQCYGPQIAKAK